MNNSINRQRRTIVLTSVFSLIGSLCGTLAPLHLAMGQDVNLKIPEYVAIKSTEGAYVPVKGLIPGEISGPINVDKIGVYRVSILPVKRHSMFGEVGYIVSLADDNGAVLSKITLSNNGTAHFRSNINVWVGSEPPGHAKVSEKSSM